MFGPAAVCSRCQFLFGTNFDRAAAKHNIKCKYIRYQMTDLKYYNI